MPRRRAIWASISLALILAVPGSAGTTWNETPGVHHVGEHGRTSGGLTGLPRNPLGPNVTGMVCSWGHPLNSSPQLVPSICVSPPTLCEPAYCGPNMTSVATVTLIVNASANSSYSGIVASGANEDTFQFIPTIGVEMGPGGVTYFCFHNGTNIDVLCQQAPEYPVGSGIGWAWPYAVMYPNDTWSVTFNVSVSSTFPTTQLGKWIPIDWCSLSQYSTCQGGPPTYSEVRYTDFEGHGENTSFPPALVQVGASVPRYAVTFLENGLPAGTPWSLYFNEAAIANSSTTTEIVVNATDGNYVYTVSPSKRYVPNLPDGNVSVQGSPVKVRVQFSSTANGTYPVSFTEVGLPNGTAWPITVGRVAMTSTNASHLFYLPNGTFSWGVGGVVGFIPSVAWGEVSINGSAVTQLVSFQPIPSTNSTVIFQEHGLPTGTQWSICLCPPSSGPPPPPGNPLSPPPPDYGFTTTSVASEIEFSLVNYTYYIEASTFSPFFTSLVYNQTLQVTGSPVFEVVNFAQIYSVTWTSRGLPVGTYWSVQSRGTIQGSDAPQNATAPGLLNGTFAYQVLPAEGYLPETPNGTVLIEGNNVTVIATFYRTAPGMYSAVFEYFGLPSDSDWSIAISSRLLEGSFTSGLIATNLSNGTYTYYVGTSGMEFPDGYVGTVTIFGQNVFTYVGFSPAMIGSYLVNFNLTRSQWGHLWQISVGNTTISSRLPSIGIFEPNGTLRYTATYLNSSRPAQESGEFTVNGNNVTVPLFLTPPARLYAVNISEIGLPTEDIWSVRENGSLFSSDTSYVDIDLANGSYTFSVIAPSGYDASWTSDSLNLNGQGEQLQIHFAKSPGAPNSLLGLPTQVAYFLLGVVVTLIAAMGILLPKARRARRKSRSRKSPRGRDPRPKTPRAGLPDPPKGHTWQIVREPLTDSPAEEELE